MIYNLEKRQRDFIEKSIKIHGDTYRYDLVNYKNSHTPIQIKCIKHGIFTQRPRTHIEGSGCPTCSLERRTHTPNQIIYQAQKVHNNKYSYAINSIKGYKSKMTIVCPIHGTFTQLVSTHLQGAGCIKCSITQRQLSRAEFIDKANTTHNEFYNYEQVNYINIHTKVNVICKKHGKFSVSPALHIQRTGCPNCRSSSKEKSIKQILEKLNIMFFEQHRFEDCRDKYPLPFDFFLPNNNILIEYDGAHHFEPIPFNGSLEKAKQQLIITKQHDEIKNQYCLDKNITLVRISFKEDPHERLKILLG